jgi:hypothetical protein
MIRNLKALGLALVAVLAMSAVAVSAAQAEGVVTAENYPVTLTGTQENNNIFKVGAVRSVECKKATLDSTLTGPTKTALTTTAAYGECSSSPSALPATVNMNSCDYTLTANTPVAPANTTGSATVSVFCGTAGDGIHVTVYKGVPHTETACTYKIDPTDPEVLKGTIEYHNIGAGTTREITAELNLKEIKTTVLTGTKLLCGGAAGETVNSTYTGNVVITGENAFSEHVGVWVAH